MNNESRYSKSLCGATARRVSALPGSEAYIFTAAEVSR